MLKVGIIGGGLNSAVGNAHLAAIRLSNNYEIVAACFSRDLKINNETANNVGIFHDKVYSDYSELIDDNIDILDAVIILTPTDKHIEPVIYALKRNINVICEKALAPSVNQALEIKNVLEKSSAKLFVIYNYLGYPMVKELRAIIEKGELGDLFSIQVEMPQEGFIKTTNGNLAKPQSWRLYDNNLIPTLSLDLGVHLHILIKFITDLEPLNVVAVSKSRGEFLEITNDVNAIIEYSSDVLCNMWYGKTSLGHRNGMKIRLYGSKGSLFWEQVKPEYIVYNDIEGRSIILDRNSPSIEIANSNNYNFFKGGHPTGFIEALANYYNDIYKLFGDTNSNSKKKNVYGIDESIEGLKLFEAINTSSNTKNWVKI
jgi:predicted dehydrogenase